MNRLELLGKVAEKTGVTKTDAGKVLSALTEEIIAAVKGGDTVTLIGFGTFKSQERPARKGHNPATGAVIDIAATRVPKFTPGAAFKEAVRPCKACKKGSGKKRACKK